MISKAKLKILIVLIASLLIISIALIYYFSSGDDLTTSGNTKGKTIRMSQQKLNKDIDSIIFTFGIKRDWIRNIASKEKNTDNKSPDLWISKDVSIPSDLPLIELNHEIANYLAANNFVSKVSESPKTKNVMMNFFYSPDTAYRNAGNIRFIYSDSIKRNAAAVCIVLDSIDSYSLSDVEKILSSSQDYSVILPLSNDKADYQSKILDVKKDYVLIFSVGGEKDIVADFKDDMKENLWRSKIRTAGLNFPDAGGIIFTGNTGSAEFKNEIINEFLKNNLIVYIDTMFTNLNAGEDKVESLFDDVIDKTLEGRKYLFYKINLSPAEFSSFENRIYKFKKAGYRFYTFTEILKKINTPAKK